ncbi:AI-2E family transporter [Arthrobacter sp. H14-L1]|uniref:AI-2E family transporter n=1 Tax=Arthrobacter sp. H14-L1 TaxID=2996697 RepID=UPI00226F8FE2|nr:AI-2E family transporter [Arthrobacter sp. H14-L1]MCY0903742.1 AI-2E family transporter [Arthrobacter sp. H14-L1]
MDAGHLKAFRVGLIGALGVGVGLVIWGAVASLSTVLSYIGIALFIALGLDPIIRWLEHRHLPRSVAVAVVLIALLVIVTALVLLFIPRLITQTKALIPQLPGIFTQVADAGWVSSVEQLLAGYLDVNSLVKGAGDFFSKPANLMTLGGGILAVGSGIATGLTGILIVVVLTLYFVITLPAMKRAAYQLVPASRRAKFTEVTEDISTAVSSYVIGQLGLAILNGVLSAIFLSLVHAPIPLLLALLAFVGALIPLVGTVISAVIITLVSLVSSPQTALIVGIYYLVYMQVEAYILTPRIMNKAVAVPGSLVVISAVAGGTLGGILGALVAIPLAASGIIIVQKVLIPRQNSL